MPDLSIAEARARAAVITDPSYRIELDITDQGDTFGSRTTVNFRAQPGGSSFIDVKLSSVEQIRLNGEPIPPGAVVDGRLRLDDLRADNELVIAGRGSYSHDGEGLHRSTDAADSQDYLYAMSFLDAAPRTFACFDQPDLKGRYQMSVQAPQDWLVLGNGPARKTGPGRYEIAAARPLSSYFVTIVAGPYHQLTREHDGITLGIACRASLAEQLDAEADDIFEVTAQALDAYHEMFGFRYPFGDYHQVFVPDFNAGAMENPGCVTLRDEMLPRAAVTEAERAKRATTIVHEMAHQWFGDTVTMRWWNDLWLNESFAENMAHRVAAEHTKYDSVWVDFAHDRKWWGMSADQRPTTHPVAPDQARNARASLQDFDGISYAKGAVVLKQLQAYLGDEIYLAGIRDHIERNAFGNATFDDLVAAWTRAGAQDLDRWADGWLRTAGMDTIEVTRTENGVRLTRTPPVAGNGQPTPDQVEPADRLHRITVGCYSATGVQTRSVLLGDEPVEVDLDGRAPVIIPDCHDQTWARIRLDAETLAALPQWFDSIESPLTRAVVWNSLRQAVADAELDPQQLTDLICAGIGFEDSEVAMSELTSWAQSNLLGGYLDYAPAAAQVNAALGERLRRTEAGSGMQLALARAWIDTTTEPDRLQDLLEGRGVPDGLEVDVELRWRVVLQQARLGATDAVAIDAEKARDPSSEGALHAIRCRAALPNPEDKRWAWQLIAHDRDASNYQVYAACEGFWHPTQLEVTRPYAERFMTEIPRTEEFRSGWVVGRTALLGYPRPHLDPNLVAAARRTGADEAIDPGIRRSLIDGAFDVARFITSREKFDVRAGRSGSAPAPSRGSGSLAEPPLTAAVARRPSGSATPRSKAAGRPGRWAPARRAGHREP